MHHDYFPNLFQRLEEQFPEAAQPEVAASIKCLKRAYESELRTKRTYAALGIKMPKKNELLPDIFPLSGGAEP